MTYAKLLRITIYVYAFFNLENLQRHIIVLRLNSYNSKFIPEEMQFCLSDRAVKEFTRQH